MDCPCIPNIFGNKCLPSLATTKKPPTPHITQPYVCVWGGGGIVEPAKELGHARPSYVGYSKRDAPTANGSTIAD